MENNALITLIGKNTVDGEVDSFELTTEGKYMKQNGKYLVSYEGSEITGYDNTTTTLKIQENLVSMIRFGKSAGSSQMIFEENKQYTGVYRTPHGNMSVDVYTNEMQVNVDDCGGEVMLDYFVQLNSCQPVRNNLRVKIRKVED
ncbi:MAG: DUF1934 domain-containing protein [Clostridia bacterium]|nr:DUF1934 domain-containing protein [Clostridia bacterium]